MMDNLISYYGFSRTPFGRDLAPGMLHRHSAHNEALARIGWCIAERRIGVITGEVGVGKTHLATALGHMAIRRRNSVLFARSDKLFTRLRAARLDNTVDAEIRLLTTINVLIIDDFALRPLGATETSDFYEIIVERHRAKTTIVTSNREPSEWLTMTADTLLAQSAIDRLTATAHTLVIEGPSYRERTRPSQLDPDHDDELPQ